MDISFPLSGAVCQGRLVGDTASEPSNASGQPSAGSWILLVEGEYLLKEVTADSTSLTTHMQSFEVI